jgi:UDP-glucose 4-epimerase
MQNKKIKMNSKMRLLITGGAGCLGSSIIEYYFSKGHEICVIDNFATGKREVVPVQSGLILMEGSITKESLVKKAFKDFQPTHVIHSAAAYKDPLNWSEDAATNILGTINVAQAAKENGVQRFINFQTALCYGRPNIVPIPVDHPTAPFTSYGISKTAGESYLIQSGLPVVSLRLANICGPRLAIGPIPTFYKCLKANQDCFCSDTTRDFLDMSDFLILLDKVLKVSAPTGIFNVSTGEGHSIYDLFRAVADYLSIDPPEVPIIPAGEDDVPVVILDPSETEKVFDWRAKIGFVETITNQLSWYEQYGVTDVFSHLATPNPNLSK